MKNITVNEINSITPQIVKFFEGKNLAFLGTLGKEGYPQVTPTWVDHEDGIILINTAEGRIKQKNVSRDSRVGISIIDQNNPYEMITIRGRVIEQTTKGADEHIDKLAKKYLGLDKYPLRQPNEKRIILKIKPEKIFHMEPPPQQ